MFAFSFRLRPSSRRLLLQVADARVAAYVRTTYRRSLANGCAVEPNADVASIAGVPPQASFNGEPLRPEARDDPASWRSGAYLADQCVWRCLAGDPDWLALYGCALQLDGRALLIVGASGIGKTTLGLALTRRGAAFLGDEMILIDRRTKLVASVPRALTIRPGTLELLDDDRLRGTIAAGAVALDARGDGSRALEPEVIGRGDARPLGAVVLLARTGDARPVACGAARAALALGPYLAHKPVTFAATAALAELLGDTPVYELRAGSPAATAALLTGLPAA